MSAESETAGSDEDRTWTLGAVIQVQAKNAEEARVKAEALASVVSKPDTGYVFPSTSPPELRV